MLLKNKIIHTWHHFEKIGIRFEKNDGSIQEGFIKNDWFFGIKKNDIEKAKNILGYSNIEFKESTKFPEYCLIYVPIKVDRPDIVLKLEENGVKTYEGDVLDDRRWYIDKEVEISNNYKKLYFDIETDDTLNRLQVGRDRILSFAAIDNKGKEYFQILKEHTDESEIKLLQKVLKIISDYDLILGWNSSGFDVPYLKLRMKKYGLFKDKNYNWKKIGHFDLLKRFRHIFRFDSHLRSFSLEFISQHFLEKGKIPHKQKIIEMWKDDQKLLREYNIEDCILVKELDEKLGVSDMMIRQCQWCGVPISQFGLYSIIDAYILKKAHSIGQMCPTSIKAIRERKIDNERGNENPDEVTTEGAKYIGAIVLNPKIGKYDKVYSFDFKGLYPSMMRTSNIGYDTLRNQSEDNCIINPGSFNIPRLDNVVKPTYFIKTPSVINLAISDLIEKRGEYKKLKLKMIEEGTNKGSNWERVVSDEIIVKELANSTYGIMGLDYGRYFSIDIAESITLFGQWCITFARNFFESKGFNVIYGDTDSIFISTGKQIINVNEYLKLFHLDLEKELKEKYNIDKSFIQLNFDKEYESFILIAKKTYAGHVINIEGKKTDDIYARGMDFIKKSTFTKAAEFQKELLDLILIKNVLARNDIKDWIINKKNIFWETEFSKKDLTLINRVGQSEYKTTPPVHVRLAMNQHEKTGESFLHKDIEYIVIKSSPLIEGISPIDYNNEYDKTFYWEHKTLPVLTRITEVLFPGYDFFTKQNNLWDM